MDCSIYCIMSYISGNDDEGTLVMGHTPDRSKRQCLTHFQPTSGNEESAPGALDIHAGWLQGRNISG